jgi:hypothetical protein
MEFCDRSRSHGETMIRYLCKLWRKHRYNITAQETSNFWESRCKINIDFIRQIRDAILRDACKRSR